MQVTDKGKRALQIFLAFYFLVFLSSGGWVKLKKNQPLGLRSHLGDKLLETTVEADRCFCSQCNGKRVKLTTPPHLKYDIVVPCVALQMTVVHDQIANSQTHVTMEVAVFCKTLVTDGAL